MENNIKVANENFDWNAFENESGLYDQSKDEIAKQYDNTMSNIAVGETVEGIVSEINKREVIVNIGYKSEGVIPASEFRYNSELQVGDKLLVLSDRNEELQTQYKEFGLDEVIKF